MLELRNLSAGYRGKALLSGLDITAGRGEMTALIGRNGCGKSTLIRTISGVLEAVSGEIFHDGIPVSGKSRLERARTMSYVGTGRPRAPYLKCREAVAMGRAPWTGWTGHLGEEDRKMVDKALLLTGMQGYSERDMDGLSDGECQKIMIARALAQDTPVMLLDEPTAFLDIPGKHQTMSILRRLATGGKTILFSTHDVELAMSAADRVWIFNPPHIVDMDSGNLAWQEIRRVLRF